MTVDPEFKAKLRTIQFGKAKSSQSRMESRWERDMPAYRRLRDHGLQPPKIDGSAEIEARANSQLEVELGHMIPKNVMPQVVEGMAISREMEWKPVDSVEDRKNKYNRKDA